jgi:type IVB pilus formation R64 PilN family outer membrane protein
MMVQEAPRRFGARYGTKKALISVLAMALATAASLSGCTDPDTRAQIDKSALETRGGLDETARPSIPPKHYNPLVVTDKVWTGDTALRMHRGIPLPDRFETTHGVTVVSSEPMTLAEIVREVSQQTGIPFHMTEAGSAARPATPAAAAATAAPGGGSTPALSSSSSSNSMPIAYEGQLSGLLERLAGHFGVNWRYDGSTVSITRFETRVFSIEALPGTQQVQEGMQDDNSSSSGGSSSSTSSTGSSSSTQNSITQNSKFSIDIKYWEELDKILASMLGGTGTVVVSPSLGNVTVTTTPEIMRTVSDYLAQENQRISRQIAVNVEIYTVSLNRGINFNIAFNTALRRLGDFSGNIINGAPAPASISSGFTGGGSLSLAILNPHGFTNEVTDIFTALSGLGDTTKVAKFPLVTLNNRPVSRRIGQDINYVASATTNTTGAGTSSTFAGTSLTPGTVHQGFSVQLTPRLLDDGRILLQYSLSIIDVLSITSFNSVTGTTAGTAASAAGSSTIQLPTTSNRIFVQQSVLKSGSTLFLGGAEETDAQENSQGVGDPNFYALGGGISTDKSQTMVFFAITPQVLDIPHSEQE